MRAPLPALLLLLALAGPAAAQTLVSPLEGAFTDVYVVAGRVVDSRGEPAAGATLSVTLDQRGVRAAPLQATTNCKGDFITSFTLRNPTREGTVSVAVQGRDASGEGANTTRLDPFFRRSDLAVRLPGPWEYRCDAQQDVWPISVTVAGRVVNRTQPYERNGTTYEAEPYGGVGRLRYTDAAGVTRCPPAANAPGTDACDFMYFDERGDYRYTFTYSAPVEAKGSVTILLGNETFTVPVDPVLRLATFAVEATGRGPPPPAAEAPGPAPLLVLLAATGAALLARRRLG